MNVFDFDKTIIKKNSVTCLIKYEFKKNPKLLKYLPKIIYGGCLYLFKMVDVTSLKEYIYAFFNDIDDLDKEIETFWDENMSLVNSWYLEIKKEDDIVISGTADFIVLACMKRLGISKVIGSKIDKKTGKPLGKNCTGEEKVIRFKQLGYTDCENFYSDALIDLPMAKLAKQAYLVKGEKVTKWII